MEQTDVRPPDEDDGPAADTLPAAEEDGPLEGCRERLSAKDVAKIIKLASTMHVNAVARAQLERPYTEEDILAIGADLDIPEEFLRSAIQELLGTRPAVTFEGSLPDVRKRVVERMIAQAPRGTRLERVDETTVILRYPDRREGGMNVPAADVRLSFREAEGGQVSVEWGVDTSKFGRASRIGYWIWSLVVTLPIALLMFAAPTLWLFLLAVVCHLGFIPLQYLVKRFEQAFVEDVANSLKTIRAVDDLGVDLPEGDRRRPLPAPPKALT